MKKPMFMFLLSLLALPLFAQIPSIPTQSVYFMKVNGGYDLYIPKLPGIESVILTESQRDPAYKVTAYGLRSTVKITPNTDEKRILDGRAISIKDATCYLIDSSPEQVEKFGEFFHFFLTDEVVYGYSWSRNGRIKIESGIRINLRLFERKFGDYSGTFTDQWIELSLASFPVEKAETAIVLLHVTETDANAKTAVASSRTSGTEGTGQGYNLTGMIAKINETRSEKSPLTWSLKPLIVEKSGRFPFEILPKNLTSGEVAANENEERVILQTVYEIDDDNNKTIKIYSTYHFDLRQRLVLINQYGSDNRISAVYKIEYDAAGNGINVLHFDRDGKPVE
jgi:hypothetical protein